MNISLKDYHHTCHDGCCHTYGYELFVNGRRIGSFEGDDVHWMAELLSHYFTCKAAGLDITTGDTKKQLTNESATDL
jgi:hypothetical protein